MYEDMRSLASIYGRGYALRHIEYVKPDPSKAERCTDTVARLGDHECRVNKFTKDVFDRVGREVWYVGQSSGDVERDVERWRRWLGISE